MSKMRKRITEMEGTCPVCGTSMVIRTTREPLTIHNCTGCTNSVCITDTQVMIVPSSFSKRLLVRAEAEPCGLVVSSSLSSRYSRSKPVTEDYVDLITSYLQNEEELDPKDFVDFLDIIDDEPGHWRGGN